MFNISWVEKYVSFSFFEKGRKNEQEIKNFKMCENIKSINKHIQLYIHI